MTNLLFIIESGKSNEELCIVALSIKKSTQNFLREQV